MIYLIHTYDNHLKLNVSKNITYFEKNPLILLTKNSIQY